MCLSIADEGIVQVSQKQLRDVQRASLEGNIEIDEFSLQEFSFAPEDIEEEIADGCYEGP